MNLLNGFYETQELTSDGKQVTGKIIFNANHEIFKGHFPTIPVVPGVCMMQIVKEILEQELQRDIVMTESSQMKFLTMITPTENPEVNVKVAYSAGDTSIDVQAELYNSERAFFKLKALYQFR